MSHLGTAVRNRVRLRSRLASAGEGGRGEDKEGSGPEDTIVKLLHDASSYCKAWRVLIYQAEKVKKTRET